MYFKTNSSLWDALLHSCVLLKTFLKNRANLLPLYGKDTKNFSMPSLIMVWIFTKLLLIFIKDSLFIASNISK